LLTGLISAFTQAGRRDFIEGLESFFGELFKAVRADHNPTSAASWYPDWHKVDKHLCISRDNARASGEAALTTYLNDVLGVWTTFGKTFGYRVNRTVILCDNPLCLDVAETFMVCERCCAAFYCNADCQQK
jgi:hypothetical protein